MLVIIVYLVLSTTSIAASDLKKNVLLIVIDDLRPALGCYKDKNSITPNIDLLAKESFQFNHAYAQQALCAPSRNSLLTSRRPDSLYLYDFYSYWRLAAGNFTTLPQHFKQNGYSTASFGKIFHPGASSNWSDDVPYSWSIPPYHPPSEKYKNSRVCMDYTGKAHKNLICPVEVNLQPGQTLPDLEIMEEVKKFVTKYNSEKPFFVAVGFHKPHIPFKFPRSYLELHPLEFISKPIPQARPPLMPLVAWNPWSDLRAREDVSSLNLTFPYDPIPDNFTQLVRQSYYASVTYIDDLVGQLLKTLERKNKKNNTIIILTGDHGWSLGEHQEWAKYSNFEVAVRVPLIIYDPHLKHFKNMQPIDENGVHSISHYLTSDNLVELVDLFPTLCELANIAVPPRCSPIPSPQMLCTEGESLVPIMYDNKKLQGKLAAFSQYPRPCKNPTHKSDKPKLQDINIMGYSMRTRQYRYTEWVEFQDLTPDWKQVIATELYDHHIDPNESLNLFGRPGLEDIQKKLSIQLRAGWRAACSIQNEF